MSINLKEQKANAIRWLYEKLRELYSSIYTQPFASQVLSWNLLTGAWRGPAGPANWFCSRFRF